MVGYWKAAVTFLTDIMTVPLETITSVEPTGRLSMSSLGALGHGAGRHDHPMDAPANGHKVRLDVFTL